ncbi:MAG: carbohydrate kinase family protein [Patescibacteria group bacterium]
MSEILVSGSLAYDHIMDFPGYFRDHFMPDKLHNINVSFNIEGHSENFGGTAGNIAYTLALLGEKPSIVASVGDDFERYKTHLDGMGIDTSLIRIEPNLETAFAYILTDKGDNQIAAFHPGAGKEAYASEIPMKKGVLAIISAGCIADVQSFPEKFRQAGVKFMFDPGQSIPALSGDDLKNGITGAEAVFANDYEFTLIEFKTGWKAEDILKVANVLVITLGEAGSRVITKDGEVRVSAIPAQAVKDPTGAGDGYRAGYIKGTIAGMKPAACAQLGSACATYVVENVGTQGHTFTMEELRKRYEVSYGEALKI